MIGQLSTKARLDIIREGNYDYHYAFDETGELLHQSSMLKRKNGQVDTAVVAYQYDEKHQMTTLRKTDAHGFFSYDYVYDENGDRVKQTYYRDTNEGPNQFEFKAGKRFIISSETFTWRKDIPNEITQRFHNNYGKAYMERTTKYDEEGFPTEIVDRFLRNNRTSRVEFEYDEFGRLAVRREITNFGQKSILERRFTYDEVGNLLEENTYRDGEHKLLKQYLYDGRMLVSASIEKDVPTNFLTIIKYTYEFYDQE